MIDLETGARVLTREGEELGTIQEVGEAAFRVDASMRTDYWLPREAVTEVADGDVHLAIAQGRLDDFRADSPQEAAALDALQVLIVMHGDAMSRFRRLLGSADGQTARPLWERLLPELRLHEEMEDRYLYGPFGAEHPEPWLQSWDEEHHDQVEELDAMLQRATTMLESADAGWQDLAERIETAWQEHIRREEEEIFPRIREMWDATRRHDAGGKMLAMKHERMGG